MTATRHLARAGLIVSAAFLASRVLGWVRTIVIVRNGGSLAELDAFFAAFRIPDLIFQLVAAGALSSALIPIVSGLFATDEHRAGLAGRLDGHQPDAHRPGWSSAWSSWWRPRSSCAFITPGFDAAQTAKTVELTRIMILSPIFLALGSVATSVLNAGGRFAASAIAPVDLQPRDHRGGAAPGPVDGRRGPRDRRRARVALPPAGPAPPAGPPRLPVRARRSTSATPSRARR